MPLFRPRQRMLNGPIQFTSQPLVIALHFFAPGPIAWNIGWQSPSHGVDSERKQVIKSSLIGL